MSLDSDTSFEIPPLKAEITIIQFFDGEMERHCTTLRSIDHDTWEQKRKKNLQIGISAQFDLAEAKIK